MGLYSRVGVSWKGNWAGLVVFVGVKFHAMAKISKETVQHVAKLARLGISAKEAEKFSMQLSDVFDYMEVLEEVDTDGVEETSQVTGLENVKEGDEIVAWTASGDEVEREDLLGSSELPVESNQILVKAAVKKS
jgi:aspartyl/glutamyl-tRNA(Asn/Gln) amidotransferase C subunit